MLSAIESPLFGEEEDKWLTIAYTLQSFKMP